jgi:hypothetical protein
MSAAPVLGQMTERRQCEHTGLSIPECCCPRCCDALLRRYAPELLRPPQRSAALWLSSDFAAQRGITAVQLHEQASGREVTA